VQLELFREAQTSSGDPKKSPGESLAQASCLAAFGMVLVSDDEAYDAFSRPVEPFEFLEEERVDGEEHR